MTTIFKMFRTEVSNVITLLGKSDAFRVTGDCTPTHRAQSID